MSGWGIAALYLTRVQLLNSTSESPKVNSIYSWKKNIYKRQTYRDVLLYVGTYWSLTNKTIHSNLKSVYCLLQRLTIFITHFFHFLLCIVFHFNSTCYIVGKNRKKCNENIVWYPAQLHCVLEPWLQISVTTFGSVLILSWHLHFAVIKRIKNKYFILKTKQSPHSALNSEKSAILGSRIVCLKN